MADLIAEALTQAEALTAAARDALPGGAPSGEPLPPPRAVWGGDFADCSTAYPLAIAKALGRPPRELAALLAAQMPLEGTFFASVEAAGPGYLNFHLSPHWYKAALEAVENMEPPPPSPAPLPDQEAIRLLLDAKPGTPLDPNLPLRRDRGNPLYRLRYTLQRLNRLPEPPEAVKHSPFSPAEQSLIKSLAACPSALRLTETEGNLCTMSRCLVDLVDTLHGYHTASRKEGTPPAPRILTATQKILTAGMQTIGIPIK